MSQSRTLLLSLSIFVCLLVSGRSVLALQHVQQIDGSNGCAQTSAAMVVSHHDQNMTKEQTDELAHSLHNQQIQRSGGTDAMSDMFSVASLLRRNRIQAKVVASLTESSKERFLQRSLKKNKAFGAGLAGQNHTVAVVVNSKNKVTIYDPGKTTSQTMSWEEFKKKWSGVGINLKTTGGPVNKLIQWRDRLMSKWATYRTKRNSKNVSPQPSPQNSNNNVNNIKAE